MRYELKPVALPNGITLNVVDEGPVDAPVLIFLHGFPESHRTCGTRLRISRIGIAASRPISAAIADHPSRRMSMPTRLTS